MIRKLSNNTALFLCKKSNCKEEMLEIVSYGIEALISLLINTIIVIICGVLAHNILAAAVYYISFLSMRFLYGGYHAKSHLKCKLIFAVVTFLVLLFVSLIRYSTFADNCVLLIVSIIPLLVLKPEVSKKRFDIFRIRKISVGISLIWSILDLVLFSVNREVSMAVSLSIAVVSISLLIKKSVKEGLSYEYIDKCNSKSS